MANRPIRSAWMPTLAGGTDIDGSEPPLDGGGDGPHDPGMEARVAVLEQIAKDTREGLSDIRSEVRAMRQDIARVDNRITGLDTRLSRVEGRLDHLPSAWLMITTMLGGQATLAGLLFVALKYIH